MKIRILPSISVLKWIVFGCILFLLFLLQGIPGFLVFFGAAPNLLIPYIICVSLFEQEKEASIIGLAAGVLMDLSSQRPLGFSAIFFIIFCVATSLLVAYLMKPNLGNAFLLCAGSLFLYYAAEFFFYDVIWGYTHLFERLLWHYMLPFVYTLVLLPIFFYLVRFLNRKFRRELL